MDAKSAFRLLSCDPRIEPYPDPRLPLLGSSPRPPLTEGTDVDRISPPDPLLKHDKVYYVFEPPSKPREISSYQSTLILPRIVTIFKT